MPRPATVKEVGFMLCAQLWETHSCDVCSRPTIRQKDWKGRRICFGCKPMGPHRNAKLSPKMDKNGCSGQQPKHAEVEHRVEALVLMYSLIPRFSVSDAPWAEEGRTKRDSA